MFLTSTSDIIRVVTGSAVTISVQASWVDNTSTGYDPGRTNTNITTATTTAVVSSPAASTQRNVRFLSVMNKHATSSCVITIQHFDGTTTIDLEKLTLLAGEQFVMCEDGEFRHLSAAGGEYDYVGPSVPNLGITGTIAETIPRETCNEVSGTITSGILTMQAIILKAGQLVSNISFFSGSTAAVTPTNQFFALYSRGCQLLAQSADQTTTAWAANTIKTLAMTTPYRVPVTGVYMVAVMVAATTPPTLKTNTEIASNLSAGLNDYRLRGNSTTGLTTALPDPAIAPAAFSMSLWAAVT